MLKLVPMIDVDFKNVVEYHDAFKNAYSELTSYTIWSVFEGEDKYFNRVKESEENSYFLIDEANPEYIIGYGSIDNSELMKLMDVGNIGYAIRPDERRKGYGTEILRLLLKKCKELGMSKVYVSCKIDNTASKQVILNNGGVFEKEFFDEFAGHGLKYRIKTKATIIDKAKVFVKKCN